MNEKFTNQFELLGNLVTGDSQKDSVHDFYRNYFKLPGNPFPPSGIADVTEENPPFQQEVYNKILNFIKTSYMEKQFHSLCIVGEYGTGKTHTLRFIEHVVNTYMNKGDQAARAIYVERPRIEINELNRTILRRLGLDTVRKYIWFAIRDLILIEMSEESEHFKTFRNGLTIPQPKPNEARLWNENDVPVPSKFTEVFNPETLNDYRTFLKSLEQKGWKREQIRYYLIDILVKAVGEEASVDLAPTFIALLLTQDEKSFSSWESLVSITNPKATSSLSAPNFLQFLLQIMKLNGIAYVYLLLDEFEEVPEGNLLTPRQRQQYLYTLREVFDKFQEGLAVIMAITPGGLAALTAVSTPLSDRLETANLSPLDTEDAVKLIQFYLNNERESSESIQDKPDKDDIFPVSEKLLEFILINLPKNVQRTPRNLIQFLNRLFAYAQRSNITELDEETCILVLNEFGAAKPSEPNKRGRK